MRPVIKTGLIIWFILMMSILAGGVTTTTKSYYVGQGSQPRHITEFNAWTMRIDYDGTSNPVFIGEAQAGMPESNSSWRIQKIGWSGGSVVNVTWAQGSNEFRYNWSNRTAYDYS